MKIIGQLHRDSHQDYCYNCGAVFECEFSDAKEEKFSEEHTLYSVNCSNCGTEILLGYDKYKLFPWVE